MGSPAAVLALVATLLVRVAADSAPSGSASLPTLGSPAAPAVLNLTVDWFSGSAHLFSTFLGPRVAASRASGFPLRLIEVGSLEGLSASWLAANVLAPAANGSALYCLDTWAGGAEHVRDWAAGGRLSALEARFDANIALALDRAGLPRTAVSKRKGLSRVQLGALLAEGAVADFVYVDGSHDAVDVLTDAAQAVWLLRAPEPGRSGGLLAFDDFGWTDDGQADEARLPARAINAFLSVFRHRVRVLYTGWQVWVERVA